MDVFICVCRTESKNGGAGPKLGGGGVQVETGFPMGRFWLSQEVMSSTPESPQWPGLRLWARGEEGREK